MTPTELRILIEDHVTVPFLTALEAIGIGETAGRNALKRNELPFRVLRMGAVLRVPTVDLAALLLTTPDMDAAAHPGAADVTATTTAPQEDRHDRTECASVSSLRPA